MTLCFASLQTISLMPGLLSGVESGEALQNMIGSNSVRCEVRNKDQYGRNVSSCSVLTRQGPQDIGTFMVSNGYAVAYRCVMK